MTKNTSGERAKSFKLFHVLQAYFSLACLYTSLFLLLYLFILYLYLFISTLKKPVKEEGK